MNEARAHRNRLPAAENLPDLAWAPVMGRPRAELQLGPRQATPGGALFFWTAPRLPQKLALLRRAGLGGVTPLPFETHQRKVIGRRTANTFCSGLLPIGTGWEHRPMRRPRLSQSSGHGDRKQRYGDCFQHVRPPFFRLQRYCRSDELKVNSCLPEWQPQKEPRRDGPARVQV